MWERSECPSLLRCSGLQVVHNQVVVDANRQRAVAGDISTYGAHDLALGASCNHPVLLEEACCVQMEPAGE
jgi:hypothetical protein